MRRQRLRRAIGGLVGAALAGLVMAGVSGAGHDGTNVFHLGEGVINTFGPATAVVPSAASVIDGENTNSGDEADGVRGFHLSSLGQGNGVFGATFSNGANAWAVAGQQAGSSPAPGSAGVFGLNGGTGNLGVGTWGHHAGSGWGVFGSTPLAALGGRKVHG